jgi:putative zincin peptidase
MSDHYVMDLAPHQAAVEWRPGPAEVRAWSVIAVVVTVLGLPLFALPTLIQHPGGGSIRVGLVELLLIIALVALLAVVHEGIHGLVMLAFGARPTFGAVLVAHVMPALYATSVGHRFTRLQYFLVAVAPAFLISTIGLGLCWAGWTSYLIAPLAVHLGGCVGDAGAVVRLLREAPGTLCEDLKDGIRFFRPA